MKVYKIAKRFKYRYVTVGLRHEDGTTTWRRLGWAWGIDKWFDDVLDNDDEDNIPLVSEGTKA